MDLRSDPFPPENPSVTVVADRRAKSDTGRHVEFSWASDMALPSPRSRSGRLRSRHYESSSDSEPEGLRPSRSYDGRRRSGDSESFYVERNSSASQRLHRMKELDVREMELIQRERRQDEMERELQKEVEELRRKTERETIRRVLAGQIGEISKLPGQDSMNKIDEAEGFLIRERSAEDKIEGTDTKRLLEKLSVEEDKRGDALRKVKVLEEKRRLAEKILEEEMFKRKEMRREAERRLKEELLLKEARKIVAEKEAKEKAIAELKRQRREEEEAALERAKRATDDDKTFEKREGENDPAGGNSEEHIKNDLKDITSAAAEEEEEADEKAKKEELLAEKLRATLREKGYSAASIERLLTSDHAIKSTDSQIDRSRPIYIKVNRKYLLPETLDVFELPWEFDRNNPDYLIIKKYVDSDLQDQLFEHTRILRERRLISRTSSVLETETFRPRRVTTSESIGAREKDKLYIVRKKDHGRSQSDRRRKNEWLFT